MSDLSPNADAVFRADPGRFQTILLAPQARRAGLFTLAAFDLEMDRQARRDTEPMLATIRLRWWADALGPGNESPDFKGVFLLDQLRAMGQQVPGLLAEAGALIEARLEDPAFLSDGLLSDLSMFWLGGDDNVRAAAMKTGQAWGLTRKLAERVDADADKSARDVEEIETLIAEARTVNVHVPRPQLSPLLLARVSELALKAYRTGGVTALRTCLARPRGLPLLGAMIRCGF